MSKVVIVPSGFNIMNGILTGTANGGYSVELASTKMQSIPLPPRYDSFTGASHSETVDVVPDVPMGSFIYDPLYEVMNWYGCLVMDSYEVDQSTLSIKFWRQADLHEWLEANMEDYVFIQKSYYDKWRLNFSKFEDSIKFNEWYGKRVKEHLVIVGTNSTSSQEVESKIKEMKDWCNEHIKSKSEIRRSATVIHAYIKDEVEAVAFKLRWIGHQKSVDL